MIKSWIIITGGAGYIGKHIVIHCLREGYGCIVIDNLSCSDTFDKPLLLTLSRCTDPTLLETHKTDIRDYERLDEIFKQTATKVSLIIHLAALKSIPESIQNPELYRDVNLNGTKNLIKLAKIYKINKFVFSSTASVYASISGDFSNPSASTGYQETSAKAVDELSHEYAKTKRQGELLLEESANSNNNTITYIALRYFNPIGNILSGQIGENLSNPKASGLMAQLGRTILGFNKSHEFNVYGIDYQYSPDGTAMRDFIDVNDLANAHLSISVKLNKPGYYCYNIGTGKATSVSNLIGVLKKYVNGIPIKYVGRREGDQAICFANTTKINNEMQWFSSTSIDDSCKSFSNRCNLLSTTTTTNPIISDRCSK